MPSSDSAPYKYALLLSGILGAVVVSVPSLVAGNDFGAFILSGFLLLLIGFLLLVLFCLNIRRRTMNTLLMPVIFAATLLFFRSVNDEVRSKTRWLLHSRTYKAGVLAQSDPKPGELKHDLWEGWGGPGAGDTDVYLVFDPTDTLSTTTNQHAPITAEGIPCPFVRSQRLEKQWYTVLYYTEQSWNDCGP